MTITKALNRSNQALYNGDNAKSVLAQLQVDLAVINNNQTKGDLQKLLDLQKSLDDKVFEVQKCKYSSKGKIVDTCNALIAEIIELMHECNGIKFWSKLKPLDGNKIREEFIDCMHFMLSMAYELFEDAQDLIDCYSAKNDTNLRRLQEGGKWIK